MCVKNIAETILGIAGVLLQQIQLILTPFYTIMKWSPTNSPVSQLSLTVMKSMYGSRTPLHRSGVKLRVKWRQKLTAALQRLVTDSFFVLIFCFSSHPRPPLPRDRDEYPPRPPQYCCCWYCSLDMAFLISHCKEDNTVGSCSKDALVVRSLSWTRVCDDNDYRVGWVSVPC